MTWRIDVEKATISIIYLKIQNMNVRKWLQKVPMGLQGPMDLQASDRFSLP